MSRGHSHCCDFGKPLLKTTTRSPQVFIVKDLPIICNDAMSCRVQVAFRQMYDMECASGLEWLICTIECAHTAVCIVEQNI